MPSLLQHPLSPPKFQAAPLGSSPTPQTHLCQTTLSHHPHLQLPTFALTPLREQNAHPHSHHTPGSAVCQPLILGSLEHLWEHSPAHPTGQLSIPSTSPPSTQQPRCLHLASKPPSLSPEAKIALVSWALRAGLFSLPTVYPMLSLFLPCYLSSLSGQGFDLICLCGSPAAGLL